MISEVAGDPTTLPGLRAEHENAPRRPGASPPRSLAADAYDCIMVHSIPKGSTEYKAVARDQRPTSMASSPRILSAAIAASHVTSNQVRSLRRCADPRPSPDCGKREPAMRSVSLPSRRILPSCSRPSRTLRAADAVARRRAILDRRCARRRSERAAGAEEWLRRGRTKELEKEKEWKRMKIAS